MRSARSLVLKIEKKNWVLNQAYDPPEKPGGSSHARYTDDLRSKQQVQTPPRANEPITTIVAREFSVNQIPSSTYTSLDCDHSPFAIYGKITHRENSQKLPLLVP